MQTPLMLFRLPLLLLGFLGLFALPGSSDSDDTIAVALLASHAPSVVRIEVVVDGKVAVQGSGFFVGVNQLVTAHHILDTAVKKSEGVTLRGRTASGATFPIKLVLAADSLQDLLVCEVEFEGLPVTLAEPDYEAGVGSSSYSIGFPADGSCAVRFGPVTDLDVMIERREGWRSNIELGFSGQGGFSGSPVLSPEGRVYGMVLGRTESAHSTLGVQTRALCSAVALAKKGRPRSIPDYIEQRIAAPGTPGEVLTVNSAGVLKLGAASAIAHGERIQLERKGLYYCVGFWTQGDDYLTWEIDLPAAGSYALTLFSACPRGVSGTPVAFVAAESRVDFHVTGTDSFVDFHHATFGELELPAGRSTVSLRATEAPGYAVMDLDTILLTPAAQLRDVYHPTALPEDVAELFIEDGNLNADVALVVVADGPLSTLEMSPLFDEWRDSVHLVFVHQAQTWNPSIGLPGFDFKDAQHESTISTRVLARVTTHLRKSKSTVLAYGASYGAHLLQDTIDSKEKLFDAVGLTAGRVDMDEDLWRATRAGKRVLFDFRTQEWIHVGPLFEPGQSNAEGLLRSALGHKRNSALLAESDLSHVVFQFGDRDRTVGALSDSEIEFLLQRGAKVLPEEGLDHNEMTSPQALRRLLGAVFEVAGISHE